MIGFVGYCYWVGVKGVIEFKCVVIVILFLRFIINVLCFIVYIDIFYGVKCVGCCGVDCNKVNLFYCV